jgi:hypothetical protein
MAESAFVVFVPEAESLVQDLRQEHDPSALAGIAAHVTVLFPFMEPSALTPSVLAACQAVLAAHATFAFTLGSVGRFPSTAYLEPSPPEPFVSLTHALWAEFPSYPPFAGEFVSVVPHLTVSHGSAQAALSVAEQLASRLQRVGPIAARCRSVSLVENSSGSWRRTHEFQLAPEPGS